MPRAAWARAVNARWQQYLALPPEMYTPNQHPAPQAVAGALARYQAVAKDPKYRALTQRGEFQETLGLLEAYHNMQAASATGTQMTLPAPP